MKLTQNSSLAALVVTFGGIYPFLLLGDALDWPHDVQMAIGIVALVVMPSVKLAVMPAERRYLRQRARQRERQADAPAGRST